MQREQAHNRQCYHSSNKELRHPRPFAPLLTYLTLYAETSTVNYYKPEVVAKLCNRTCIQPWRKDRGGERRGWWKAARGLPARLGIGDNLVHTTHIMEVTVTSTHATTTTTQRRW